MFQSLMDLPHLGMKKGLHLHVCEKFSNFAKDRRQRCSESEILPRSPHYCLNKA